MGEAKPPRLPLELILRIVECLAPVRDVALPPHSPTATSIKSFTLVCRATYPIALRLLYSHCLYIDKSERLGRLLTTLDHLAQGAASYESTYDYDTGDAHEASLPLPRTLPYVDVRSCLQNLYLAPFPPRTIDDLPTAQWIFELFSIARHTLRRLVINIPFDTVSLYRDHLDVREWLDRAFRELTSIEEFVCPNSGLELPLLPPNMPIWIGWTKLRRLALHVDTVGFGPFLMDLHHLPQLDHLVLFPELPQSRTLIKDFRDIMKRKDHDVQFTYIIAWVHDYESVPMDSTASTRTTPNTDISESVMKRYAANLSSARLWNLDERHGLAKIRFRYVAVDVASVSTECTDFNKDHGVWPVQAWVRTEAVGGSLWDVEGSGDVKQSQLDPAFWFNMDFNVPRWLAELHT